MQTSVQRVVFLGLILGLLFAVTARGDGLDGGRCPLGALNPERVVEVTAVHPVHHQVLGSCSSYAFTDVLSHFAKDSTGKPMALAVDYLIALEVAAQTGKSLGSSLEKSGDPSSRWTLTSLFRHSSTPGSLQTKLDLLKKYGAVPAQHWKPKVPVETFLDKGGLEPLFAPGGRHHDNYRRIAEQALAAGKRNDYAAVKACGSKLEELVLRALEEELGVSFTAKFRVEGRDYDPRTFESTFLGSDRITVDEYRLNTRPSYSKPGAAEIPFGSFSENYAFERSVPYEEVERKLRDALDGGTPLLVSTLIDQKVVARTGILDSARAEVPPETMAGHHAMHVVGYVKDDSGNLAYWKVKNSWGTASGADGFLYLTPNYVKSNSIHFEILRRRADFPPPPAPRRWWPALFGK